MCQNTLNTVLFEIIQDASIFLIEKIDLENLRIPHTKTTKGFRIKKVSM